MAPTGPHEVLEVLNTAAHRVDLPRFRRRPARVRGDGVEGRGTQLSEVAVAPLSVIVEPADGDMLLYLESLRNMATLEPAGLLPAQGTLIEHRLMRERKVVDALEARGKASRPRHLVANAYADTPKALWPLALQSIEAHLFKLEREGRVWKEDDRWAPVPVGTWSRRGHCRSR